MLCAIGETLSHVQKAAVRQLRHKYYQCNSHLRPPILMISAKPAVSLAFTAKSDQSTAHPIVSYFPEWQPVLGSDLPRLSGRLSTRYYIVTSTRSPCSSAGCVWCGLLSHRHLSGTESVDIARLRQEVAVTKQHTRRAIIAGSQGARRAGPCNGALGQVWFHPALRYMPGGIGTGWLASHDTVMG